MGAPGPLQPGRTETGLGWPQAFWGGDGSASLQPHGGLAPRGDGLPRSPSPAEASCSQRSVSAAAAAKKHFRPRPGTDAQTPRVRVTAGVGGHWWELLGGAEGLQGPLPSPRALAGCVALKSDTALSSSVPAPPSVQF